jgi:hypothetical protein
MSAPIVLPEMPELRVHKAVLSASIDKLPNRLLTSDHGCSSRFYRLLQYASTMYGGWSWGMTIRERRRRIHPRISWENGCTNS